MSELVIIYKQFSNYRIIFNALARVPADHYDWEKYRKRIEKQIEKDFLFYHNFKVKVVLESKGYQMVDKIIITGNAADLTYYKLKHYKEK